MGSSWLPQYILWHDMGWVVGSAGSRAWRSNRLFCAGAVLWHFCRFHFLHRALPVSHTIWPDSVEHSHNNGGYSRGLRRNKVGARGIGFHNLVLRNRTGVRSLARWISRRCDAFFFRSISSGMWSLPSWGSSVIETEANSCRRVTDAMNPVEGRRLTAIEGVKSFIPECYKPQALEC